MQPIPPLPPLQDLLDQVSALTGMPAVITVALCAFLIVAARDWRIVVAAFMLLSIALSLLTSTVLPPEWALLRVIAGGLVAIIWYLSAQRAGWGGRFLPFRSYTGVKVRPLSTNTVFRTLAALVLILVLVAARPRLPLPPISTDLRLAVTWLAAFAVLGLALGDEALQVGTALLMVLGASQLLVSSLQHDPWLLWLLYAVELLVGLATAYLIIARGPADSAQTPEDGR